MSLKKVYLTTKTADTTTTHREKNTNLINTEWGIHAAMSALWLKKTHTAPLGNMQQTKPEPWEATAIWQTTASGRETSYKQQEQLNEMILKKCDLAVLATKKTAAENAIEEVRENSGYYYIDIGNHVFGCISRGEFFYFDPNYGLFHSNEGIDIVLLWAIKNIYGNKPGYRDDWLLYSLTNMGANLI